MWLHLFAETNLTVKKYSYSPILDILVPIPYWLWEWKNVWFLTARLRDFQFFFFKKWEFWSEKKFTKLLLYYLQLCLYVSWPFSQEKQAKIKICLWKNRLSSPKSCWKIAGFVSFSLVLRKTKLCFSLFLLRKWPWYIKAKL